MTFPPTTDGLYNSSRRYGRLALEAYGSGRHHLVALYAGTALEHLAKACLAKRSPVLLAELRSESSFRSVLLLLEISTKSGQLATNQQVGQLRTVGLRVALERTRLFVAPTANWEDLMTLADMRDGMVHAATDDEVAMKLVVAFVQHVDTLLADLQRQAAGFWGSQQSVTIAILRRNQDRVAHIVQVKLASARAVVRQYRQPLVLEAIRQTAAVQPINDDQARAACPSCKSAGIATGFRDATTVSWPGPPDGDLGAGVRAIFAAESFVCSVCRLSLSSPAEIEAAGMPQSWRESCDEVTPVTDD